MGDTQGTQNVATYRLWFSGANITCRPSADFNCRDQIEALTKKLGGLGLDQHSEYRTGVGEQRLSFRYLTASSPREIKGPYITLIDRVIASLGLQELRGHGYGSRLGNRFVTSYEDADVPVLSADAELDRMNRDYKMPEGVDLMLCGYFYYRKDLRKNPTPFVKDNIVFLPAFPAGLTYAQMETGRDFNCAAIVTQRAK